LCPRCGRLQTVSKNGDQERHAKSLAGFILSAWQGTLLRVRATRDREPLKEFQRMLFNVLLK